MNGFAFLVVSVYCLAMSQAAPRCPFRAIMECNNVMIDIQYTDIQDMCSLFETYLSCMEPYQSSLNACPSGLSSGYRDVKSYYEKGMSTICSVNLGPKNGIADDTNFTEPINETEEVQEVPCPEFLKCYDPNATAALIPTGRLEKGFYFQSSYAADYCRYSAEATSCMSDPKIVNNPGCAPFVRYTRLETDTHDLVCSQQGQRDIEVIRQCANNLELQREVLNYVKRTEGRVEGLYSYSTDKMAVLCNEMEIGISSLLRMVDDKCGAAANAVLVRFMKEIIPSVERDVPEVSQFCPTFADFIKAL